MIPLKAVVGLLGAIGLLLAGLAGHPVTSPRHLGGASPAGSVVQFGGVSAETATSAGTQSAGGAWFTQGPDGLTRRLSTGR